MHPRSLAACSDGGLAAGLDDARSDAQALGTELRVAHAVAVAGDVVETLARLIVGVGVEAKRREDVVDLALVQLIAPLLGPLLCQVATGAIDGLGHIP